MPKKKISIRDRMIASARRKIKSRRKAIDDLEERYGEAKQAVEDQIAEQQEILRLFKVKE